MDARSLMSAIAGERDRFVRLARLRVGTEADAEDVVQRALTRAADNAGSVVDPARPRAWFYRILRHAIADHHRRPHRDPMRHRDDSDVAELAGEQATQTGTPCRCAMRLLGELRPAYAEVIQRVDVNGEDAGAAAQALGVTPGNLHVRLHRARRALRDDVRHHCGVVSHRPCLDCVCDGHHRCGSVSA